MTLKCKFYSDWPSSGKSVEWNWIDFTFIKVYVTNERYIHKGLWDINLGLLGLNITITIKTDACTKFLDAD